MKKGNVSIYLVSIIFVTIILLIATVVAPFGTLITAEFYTYGENIMLDANETVQNINNTQIKESFNNQIGAAVSQTEDNITIYTALYKWGWLAALAVVLIGLFLLARLNVEYGGGGLL